MEWRLKPSAMFDMTDTAALWILGLGAAASYVVKPKLSYDAAPAHNDIPGRVFAVVSALYSILLAFVVIAVWEQFTDAEHATASEAALMITAYRDTQGLAEPQGSQAREAFRTYADEVITSEWADHAQTGSLTPDLLNPIHAVYADVEPDGDVAAARLAAAAGHLYALEVSRHERHLALEHRLPSVFWLVLPLGALSSLTFLFFFQFVSRRLHAALTGLLAAALVAVMSLIVALDSPYSGGVQVSKYPFENAIVQMDAIDLVP